VLHYHAIMEVETLDVIILTTFSILMEIVIFQNCRQKRTDHMPANKAVRLCHNINMKSLFSISFLKRMNHYFIAVHSAVVCV